MSLTEVLLSLQQGIISTAVDGYGEPMQSWFTKARSVDFVADAGDGIALPDGCNFDFGVFCSFLCVGEKSERLFCWTRFFTSLLHVAVYGPS